MSHITRDDFAARNIRVSLVGYDYDLVLGEKKKIPTVYHIRVDGKFFEKNKNKYRRWIQSTKYRSGYFRSCSTKDFFMLEKIYSEAEKLGLIEVPKE